MESHLSSRRSVDNLPPLPTTCASTFEFFSTPLPKLNSTATAVAAGDGYSGVFNQYRQPIGNCVLFSSHTYQLVRELGGGSNFTVDRELAAAHPSGFTLVPCSPRIREILLDDPPHPRNLSASLEHAATRASFLAELSAADSPTPTPRGRLRERFHTHHDGDNPHPTRGRDHTRRYASPDPDHSNSPEAPDTEARTAAHHRRFVSSSASDDPLPPPAFTASTSRIPSAAPSGTRAFSPIQPHARPRPSAPALARASEDAPLRPGRNHSGSLPPINRTSAHTNAAAPYEPAYPTRASPSSVHAFSPDSPQRDANQYKKIVAARHLSALLLAIGAKLPHTYRAYFDHEPTCHTDLDVLPLSTLHEAIDCVVGQWYGYLLVSNSVKRAAPGYGDLGKEAASAFASANTLDLLLADAILAKTLNIEQTPADRVLCLLPIAQLALAIASTYLRRPDEGLSAAVLVAAASVSFTDPRQPGKLRISGLDQLRAALGHAQESGAHCDWNAIYKAIAKHIVSTSNIHYESEGSYDVLGDRMRPPLSWDNFRGGVKQKLEQAKYSTNENPVYFTAGHLNLIASKLSQFSIEVASDALADPDSEHDRVHAVFAGQPTSPPSSSPPNTPVQESVADVLAVLRSLVPTARAQTGVSPPPAPANFRPDQPCWTLGCAAKTTSRRVSCLKCMTIRPGAWMCPTCHHGNPASSNVCISRGCTGDRANGRNFTTNSADGARELAEAAARVAASKARFPRRSSATPAQPDPQGAPAVPLTFRITVAPDDALEPLVPPDPVNIKPELQRAPNPVKSETPDVLAVNVDPTHVSTGCQRDKQGLLFQIPVTIQNADFPLLVGQRTIEKLGWLPTFGLNCDEPWLRAPNGCFYRLRHDHGGSLCLPVVVGTLDDGGPVLYVGAHSGGRPTQLIVMDNCSQATTVPVGNADLVFARSSRPGTDVKSATGHHGVSIGSGLLRFLFCEGDNAASDMVYPFPPPTVVASILGPAALASAAEPAAAAQIVSYIPTANAVTRSRASTSAPGPQLAQKPQSGDDSTTIDDKVEAGHSIARRPFSTPMLADADTAAERFNLFGRSEIEYFPQLVDGVGPLKLDDHKGYGRGALLLQAAMRRSPIYSVLSENSHQRLLNTAPATSWDCDVFTLPEPDQDGNTTMFNFFERRTSTPFIGFSPCKGAAAFVVAITQLEIFARHFCPGVDIEDLSGDFDSSWAVNGKPGDTMPAELRTFCATRPRLRVVPKPPYSPALNRAELPQQRLKVFIMMNSVRARLSFRCICDMARGAWFQLLHQRVPHSREKVLRENTRAVALQLLHGVKDPRRLVASNMLGFPGQFGFAVAEDGKPGRLRDKGELVYYVHPDMMGMGGHWVRYVASGRLAAVRSVTLVKDPDAVPALLARPGVALAHGLLGRPPQSAYTDHVDALVKDWNAPDIELKALRIDPRTGLPTGVISYVPVFDEETRTIVAVERVDESPAAEDPTAEATPTTTPAAAATLPDATTHSTFKRLPHRALHSGRLELDPDAKAWFLRLPKSTGITVDPNGKAPGSASYDRYATYKHARTIGELGPLTGQRRKDVMWDLAHGNILVSASDRELEAAVNAVGTTEQGAKPAEAKIPPGVDPKFADYMDSLELVDEEGMARLRTMVDDAYATERRTLLEFERLENLEDNPRPLDPDGGRALHSSLIDAAFGGEDEVRVLLTRALVDDYDLAKGPTTPTPCTVDEGPDDSARVYAIGAERIRIDADVARMCAVSAVDIETPKSVKEMERHPLFDAPNGWKVDFTKEVTELLVPACEVVDLNAFHDAVAKLGAANVDMGYVVAVFRVKRDANGEFTKCRGRVAYAVQSAHGGPLGPPTVDKYANYSGCADAPSNRIHAQLALQLDAEQTSDDVPHAYWRGTPPSGRAVFAHVPEWAPRYFPGWRERYGDRTKGLLLRITANMPGRRDAGRIWFEYMDKFLRSFGLRPCAFDPRCYYLAAADGTLLVLLHVDDTRLTYTTIAVCERYRAAFKLKFSCEPAPLGQTDFTGLRHEFITDANGDRRCEITCNSAITSLNTLLADHPLPPAYSRDIPMASDALAELRLPVSVTNPLATEYLTPARRIAGTVGFIVTMVRVEGYFGFCVIARYINADRITHRAWFALLRLAHYLVHTRDLALTLWRVPPSVELEAFCDSSLGNGVEGRSLGGSMALFPGSGALWWTCSTPSKTGESTGVSELHQIVRCIKAVTGTRIYLKELGYGPTRPTLTHTDSRTALDAARSSRVSWDSKWVCTRLAMVRNYEADGTGVIVHEDTEDLVADLLSKPLVGDAFFKHRATALGLRTRCP